MNTKRSRPAGMLRAVIICAVLVGGAGLGLSRVAGHVRARTVNHYVPLAATGRISFLGDVVPDALLIRDFDASDEAIYLLDTAAPRVIILHESDGHWKTASSFGRRGGGPGEMLQPSGISLIGDSIVIADRDRFHYYTLDGVYLRTAAPSLPCPVLEPRVYGGPRGGLLIAGRCMRADTITTELFYSGDGKVAQAIAYDVLYTMDGSVGSPFGTPNSFTPGPLHGLFGGGTGDCVYRVLQGPRDTVPSARRVCGVSAPRYPFVASEEFRAKARAIAAARPMAAGALAVPAYLPAYVGRLATMSGDLVLRPFSNDSFAFRRIGSNDDVMIAEVDGLVGCRASGCLWVRGDGAPKVMFVPAAVIEGAAAPTRTAR